MNDLSLNVCMSIKMPTKAVLSHMYVITHLLSKHKIDGHNSTHGSKWHSPIRTIATAKQRIFV